MIDLITYLDKEKIVYELNKSTKELVSFKIGGIANIVIYPDKTEQLSSLISLLKDKSIKYCILGNGTNTYFSSNGYNGAVISTKLLNSISLENDKITASCGCTINNVALKACENNLTGMEFTYGMPGCIGGCIYMNASAFNCDMTDIVYKTKVLNTDTEEISDLTLNEHKYGMKHSVFMEKPEYIVLEATFKLSYGIQEEIRAKMDENLIKREASQPLDLPSAGSVFKRPLVGYSSKYIDDAGLKGERVGDAIVSTKHAGFILNTGNATSKDVKDLIEIIKDRVFGKFGVELEEEIIFTE